MKITVRILALLCAARLLLSGAALATTPPSLTITVDATKSKTLVPADFLGIFDSSNIGRGNYDPNSPYYNATDTGHLFNLIEKMGVKHWRVEGSSTNGALNDELFAFIQDSGAPEHSVEWGLYLCDVNNISTNIPTVLEILADQTDSEMLGAFSFGNEPNFNQNIVKDQYIACKRNGQGLNPSTSYFGPDVTDPPAWSSDSSYVQNDVVKYNGTVYKETNSLPGSDAGLPPPTDYVLLTYSSDDGAGSDTTDAAVWTAASTDDPSNGSPYDGGIRGRWQEQYATVTDSVAAAGYSAVSFVGPDAGWDTTWSEITDAPGAQNVPFTLQFATDESTRLAEVTQHLYVGAGDNSAMTDWSSGAAYCSDDEVYYSDAGTDRLFECIASISDGSAPSGDTAHWACLEPNWKSGNRYSVGDVVLDTDNGVFYQCIVAEQSNNPPYKSQNNMWVLGDRNQYAFPGPHQLALHDMDPDRLSEWTSAVTTELGQSTDWPLSDGQKMLYRMSEFSPFSGAEAGLYTGVQYGSTDLIPPGTDTVIGTGARTNCFASALIGLEMMHWWATKGAAGVDPIAGTGQTNSPIFQYPYGEEGTDFIAQPYAYAWPAFNISAVPGSGQELYQSNQGIAFTDEYPTDLNMTAHAVLTSDGSDLIVTIFNKTFTYDSDSNGPVSVPVTIKIINGFSPGAIRHMALNAGTDEAGDSTAMDCWLGSDRMLGADQDEDSTYTPPWTSDGQWTGGTDGSFTITVAPFSAMIVDFSSDQ